MRSLRRALGFPHLQHTPQAKRNPADAGSGWRNVRRTVVFCQDQLCCAPKCIARRHLLGDKKDKLKSKVDDGAYGAAPTKLAQDPTLFWYQ